MLEASGKHKALSKKHGYRRVGAYRSILDIAEQAHPCRSYMSHGLGAELVAQPRSPTSVWTRAGLVNGLGSDLWNVPNRIFAAVPGRSSALTVR